MFYGDYSNLIYFSHPIRGKKGAEATDEEMVDNCRQSYLCAMEIQKVLNGGDTYIYVPAEHDLFIMLGYRAGLLDEKTILTIDCQIVGSSKLMLIYDFQYQISHGCKVELDYAKKNGIPVIHFHSLTDTVIACIKVALAGLQTEPYIHIEE
jgi:hypothetical protein